MFIVVYWIKTKIVQNFLVQGPGYAKRPLGHRVAYPIMVKKKLL